MVTKFLYIDDDPDKAEGVIKPIEDVNLIFEIEAPKSWNEQKSDLIDRKRLNEYDGLLLDLKLEFSDGENNVVKYGGTELAGTIRTDVLSGNIEDLPIFLCSTDEKFMKLFDSTSDDLFDKTFSKTNDFSLPFSKLEFISYSKAYKAANENLTIENLLNKACGEFGIEELISVINASSSFKTPHAFIAFVNKDVIHSPGLLIDEKLLSIRTGIDITTSPDWCQVKLKVFESFKYEGILGDCYERWWQSELLKWWKTTFGKSLVVMTAREKVECLKEKFDFEIFPISLPPHHVFDTFWYKCRLSDNPLDPSDALRTIEMPKYVWQEPNYISYSYIKSEGRERQKIVSLLGVNELRLFENL
jgi:hypothetical protein